MKALDGKRRYFIKSAVDVYIDIDKSIKHREQATNIK